MSQKNAKKRRKAAKKKAITGKKSLIRDIPLPPDGSIPLATPPERPKKTVSFKVPGELAQAILDYLQLQRYVDVHHLIAGLTNSPKLEE